MINFRDRIYRGVHIFIYNKSVAKIYEHVCINVYKQTYKLRNPINIQLNDNLDGLIYRFHCEHVQKTADEISKPYETSK